MKSCLLSSNLKSGPMQLAKVGNHRSISGNLFEAVNVSSNNFIFASPDHLKNRGSSSYLLVFEGVPVLS